MDSIFNSLRKLAGIVSKDIHVEEIRIFFEAPDPKKPNISETIDIQKDKALAANFQWRSYQVLFTREFGGYFVYKADLGSEGSFSGAKEVLNSDEKFSNRGKAKGIIIGKIETALPTLLKETPNLFPKPKDGKTLYMRFVDVAGNEKKVQTFTPEEFQKNFRNKFYVVLNPKAPKEFKNPFGDDVRK